MTGQNLIDQALRDISILRSGVSASAEESADGLLKLNQILASWNAQALPIPQITRSTVALNGAASYALATRPMKIKAASVVVTATGNLPLHVATAAEWAAFSEKGAAGAYGELLFYEEGFPLARIHIAPLTSGTLELLSEKHAGTGAIQVRDTLALTGAASYTVGAGGNLAVERPLKITGASILSGAAMARAPEIVTAELWAAFPRKGAAANFAEVLYCDAGFPTATVRLAPNPPGGTLELYTYERLAAIASLATTITLPDGYERALRATLAVELAGEHGVAAPDVVAAIAADARTSIFGLNQAVLGPPVPVAGAAAPLPPDAAESA